MGDTQHIRRAIGSFLTKLLLLAVIIAAGIFAMSTTGSSPSQPTISPQISNTIKWAGIGILGGFGLLFTAIFIGGTLAAIGAGAWALGKGMKSIQEAKANNADKNGFRAMEELDVTPWYLKILGYNRRSHFDPERMVPAVGVITYTPSGRIITDGSTFGASDETQIKMNQANMRHRMTAAGRKAGSTKWDAFDEAGLLPYALPQHGQRALGLIPDATPAPAAQTVQTVASPDVPAKPPTLLAAIRQKSKPAEFVLGWNRDKLGKLQAALWDTYADSTLDILGKSRHGKTSTVGISLGIQMAWYNWRVLVLDPEQENTWAVLDKHLEVVPTGPDRIIGHVKAYVDEWEKRGELLAAHNVSDVRRLPESVRPPHAALIIDEYPKLRYDLGLLSGPEAVDHLDGLLDAIVQVGAKRLMRLIVIGQTRSKARPWPESVWKQGKKAVFAINVNDNSLNGYHDLMSLKIGEFAYDAERWTGWFAEPKVASIMAQAPQPRRSWPPFITGDVPRVGTAATGGRNDGNVVPTLPPPATFSPANGGAGGNVPTGNAGNDTPPALRSNEEIARLWLSHHADGELPRGWSSMLAKAIATNNNDLPNWESYKSEAARWKERYHPTGAEYRTYQPADGWPKPHGPVLSQPKGWPPVDAPTPIAPTDIFGHSLTVLDTTNPADASLLADIRQEIARGNFDVRNRK